MSIEQKQFEVGVFQRLSYKIKMWLFYVAFHYDDFHITGNSQLNEFLVRKKNRALLYKFTSS